MKEEYKLKNGTILNIFQDMSPESPREWGNLGTMMCFHKRLTLGDDHNIEPDNYASFEEMIKDNSDIGDVTLPLYLYNHGDLSISTEPFNCRWDSGQIGYITVSKDKLIKEFGTCMPETHKIVTYLENEVKVYDQYLRGETYGYTITKEETCSLGHVHKEELDSCWGFFGTDLAENGLFENAGITKEDLMLDND